MKTQYFYDDFVEQVALGNLDAFIVDMRTDHPTQTALAKRLQDSHDAEEVARVFDQFEEDMQFAACGGRSYPRHDKRLRGNGRDPDQSDVVKILGELDTGEGAPLTKRKTPSCAAGDHWELECDESGNIRKAWVCGKVDPEKDFQRLG